jgi:predicted transcriptional regulator
MMRAGNMKATLGMVAATMMVLVTVLAPAPAAACHSQTVSCDNASWTDNDMSPDTVSITPSKRDILPGESTEYHVEMFLSPGCGNQYYLSTSLSAPPAGWKATFMDGPGRSGTDISSKDNFPCGSNTVIINGYLNITAPSQAKEGTTADIAVLMGADDNARNDKDFVYVKTTTRVHIPDPPPVIAAPVADFTMSEDSMDMARINLGAVFHDPDGDPMTYRAAPSDKITVSIFQDGKVTLAPKQDWSGSETLVFYASDGTNEISDSVIVTVTPVEDAPYVASAIRDFAIPKDGADQTSVNLARVFNDFDLPYGDRLTFSVSGNANIGIAIGSDGRVGLQPSAGWVGRETITFTATDKAGKSASDDVKVTITDTSRPPYVKSPLQDIAFPEDTTYGLLDLSTAFGDPDTGTSLQYGVEGNSYLNVSISTKGLVSIKPKKDWNGAETLSFSASDGMFSPVYSDIVVTVTPVNDPPIQNGMLSIVFKEDTSSQPVFLDSCFRDVDGDRLTYSAETPDKLTVQISSVTSEMTVSGSLNYNGDTHFELTVTDGKEHLTITIPVHITPVDDPPVISEWMPFGNAVCSEGETISFSIKAVDIDGDPLGYIWSIDDNFEPLRMFEGKDSIRIKANSTYGCSEGQHTLKAWVETGSIAIPHIWSVTVRPGNRAPAVPVIRSPSETQSYTTASVLKFEALSEDLDGDAITYQWTVDGTEVTGQQFSQKLTVGIHVVRVRAVDARGASSGSQEMTLNIKAVPAPAPKNSGIPASSMAVLLSIAIAIGVLGFVAGTEIGLYGIFTFLVFLYSKLGKEQILDNFTRGKIYGYIVANPGDHYNSIMNALRLSNGTFAYHLRRLENEGLIKSATNGTLKRFYPVDMRVTENENDSLTRIQRIVFDIIVETPGISQKEISGLLSVSNATVNFHMDALIKKGFVKRERAGYKVRYYPIKQENGNGNGVDSDITQVSPSANGGNGSNAPLVNK